MKKILCLVLVLVLSFGIVSCKKDDKSGDNTDNTSNTNNDTAKATFETFTAAIASNNASSVVVDITSATNLGNLAASYEIYFAADGSATVKYEYERFLEIGEGAADETKTTVTGTVYRDKDGNYSPSAGVDVSSITAATAINIASLKSAATINGAGDELDVTVAKASTADVFGTAFDSDVALKIRLNGDKLAKITVISENKSITYTYEN